MRKSISLFMALALFFSCMVFASPSEVQAEQLQKNPFSINFESKNSDGTVKIVFSSDMQSNVSIYDGSNEKYQVFSESIVGEKNIKGLRIDMNYAVNIETNQGDLYAGTFSLYSKQDSDFIGIIFDINEIERSMTAISYIYDDRMIMAETSTEVEKNNNFKTANKLFSRSINGKIESKTDIDFYQTMFYTEGDATLLLDNIPNGKDYDLYVFDSNQKQIASSCSTSSIENIVIKDVKLNDTYYIKVVGYNNSFDKNNFYTISVNHTPKKMDNYGHTFETAKYQQF